MALPDIESFAKLDDSDWRALRARFDEVGLNREYASKITRVGQTTLDALRGPIRKWHMRKRKEPAGYLMRMCMFMDPVTPSEAREALGAHLFDRLSGVGFVVTAADERVVCPFFLNFVNDLIIVCDNLMSGEEAVMGGGATTADLCQAAYPIEPVGSVLDLGCGAGTAALLFASRAERVVGIDINPRAIEIARLNARINGIEGVEFRLGDGFAPVAGERFDLIVSQPPFVAKPPEAENRSFLYGGSRGDELTLRLLSEMPAHLADGGRAVFLVDWPVVDDEPLENRVRRAIPDPALDVLHIEGPGQELDDYVTFYAAAEHPELGAAFEDAVTSRREHLEREGITRLRLSYVVVRRTACPPGWTSTVKTQALSNVDVLSSSIDRLVAARDVLALPDDLLASTRLVVPEGTSMQEQNVEGEPKRVVVRLPASRLVPPIVLSMGAVRLVELIAGAADVREAISQFATAIDVSYEDAFKQARPAIHQALLTGVLEPFEE